MFETIPTEPPVTPLLDAVDQRPSSIKALDLEQLQTLCEELRAFLLYSLGKTGGHFGAGLGVIELTVLLHKLLDLPQDRLVWDVGHQSYPHKILTGRKEAMAQLRQMEGMSGFPKRDESEYDCFGVGHASTALSAALGMAIASERQLEQRRVIAVLGDGALSGGMAFEALAHAGELKTTLTVVVNDNQMSIGNVSGGVAGHLADLSPGEIGLAVQRPGNLFESLGWSYHGPYDGHDLPLLDRVFTQLSGKEGPTLIHLKTVKGKGYAPAEQDPVRFHAIDKLSIDPRSKTAVNKNAYIPPKLEKEKLRYQDIFGAWLCDQAAVDERLVAITPAMMDGSGMGRFAQEFPDRFFDVAIAEQHALTLAAGMACEGLKPIVAIYSTFLQRAYDQLIHDVALQKLDVTLAIDRAGLVGEDGPTHHGVFDLSFLRCIPNLVIGAPSDENECRQMLHTAYKFTGPAAIRYPRGSVTGVEVQDTLVSLEIGRGVVKRQGRKTAILNFGRFLPENLAVGAELDVTVVDMRWIKPLDTELLASLASSHSAFVTVEDNAISGGAGTAIIEWLAASSQTMFVVQLGLPDAFIEHGRVSELHSRYGLSYSSILERVKETL